MNSCRKILVLGLLLFFGMASGPSLLANPPKIISLNPPQTKNSSNNIKTKNRADREYLITVLPETNPEKVTQVFQGNLEFSRKISKNLFHIKLKNEIGLERMQQYGEQNSSILAVQPNYTYRALGSGNQIGTLKGKELNK